MLIAFAFSGCARMGTQPLSASHPGNPEAPEASYPLATATLMVGTNLAMIVESQQSPKSENAQQQADKGKLHDEHNHNTPKK